ncbi:MAG: flavodoxin family protein [Deltaproteobacteria bacterium]|nr:MAG: flavodoxin family protein [Deltaproteobacteria bacterium]
MKILGIYGSPRKKGNSEVILDEALKAAAEAGAEVKRVYVKDLKMSGCLECGGCDKTGRCVVKDDMQDVYPLMEEADAIVLAAPIFFYGMPAQAKAIVDRSQAMWAKRMLNKPREQWKNHESGTGYLIAVGATKGKNLFEGIQLVAKYFYDAMDMDYDGGLFYRGLEKKDDAGNNPEIMKEAREFGRRIVEGSR